MMNDWLSSSRAEIHVLAFFADVVVKVSILLLLAWATHAILGRRRVLIRSGLWNAVLLAAILQPAAILALPRLRVACLSASELSPNAARTPVARGDDETDSPRLLDGAGVPTTTETVSSEAMGRVGTNSRRIAKHLSVLALSFWAILGFYIAGIVFLSVRLGASLAAVARLKREAVAVDDPAWTEPLSRWRDRLGITRPVKLVWSDYARAPFLLGWLQPVILLSVTEDGSAAIPASQVDAVLLHELAHLRRGDDLWNLVQQVVQILYWPHPLIWLAARLIAGVREQACDDLCVRWVGGAHDYRAALVAVASRLVRRQTLSIPTSLGLAITRSSSSALVRRLAWIEQTRGARSCVLAWPWRLTITLAVLGVAFVSSAVELTRARAAQPTVELALLANVAADDAPAVRAYDEPVPNSAKFHTVSLTVLDDETNKPLADTEVIVLNYVDLRDYSIRTDPSGRLRFQYPYVGAKPHLSVELRKNGYVPLRRGWGFDNDPIGAVDTLVIRLRRGTTMGGIVVYKSDQPIEGVTVVMTVQKYDPEKRPKNPTGYEIYYEVASRTGPDGRWRTDSVPPGAEEVNLQLIHPDFVSDNSTTLGVPGRSPTVAALRDQTDRQVLLKGVKITGRVVDTQGKPIAGAEVVDSTRGLTFLTYVRRVLTDPDGRFHFHLPRGEVTLTAQVRGSEPATLKVAAEPDARPVEFRLALGRSLRGRVVDPRGKPIPGASLVIPSVGKHKGVFLRRWSDNEGRFEWDSAPEEEVEYSISAEGYLSCERVLLAVSNVEAIVVLEPAVDVRLRVVDAKTGEPIARFDVQVDAPYAPNQAFRRETAFLDGSDGDYRISLEAAKGPYRLKIAADGYAPAQTRLFRSDERVVRETVRLDLAARPAVN